MGANYYFNYDGELPAGSFTVKKRQSQAERLVNQAISIMESTV